MTLKEENQLREEKRQLPELGFGKGERIQTGEAEGISQARKIAHEKGRCVKGMFRALEWKCTSYRLGLSERTNE